MNQVTPNKDVLGMDRSVDYTPYSNGLLQLCSEDDKYFDA